MRVIKPQTQCTRTARHGHLRSSINSRWYMLCYLQSQSESR